METTAKILVVDDEEIVRDYLRRMLTQDGYQVVSVASGEEALEHITAQSFDLALIDLKMPGIGGMDVLAALRQRSPDTVAIVLTAHGSLETAVEALRQGAYNYLFKPCKTVEIRESVRTGLDKRQRELHQHRVMAQLQNLLHNVQQISTPHPIGELAPSPPPAPPGPGDTPGRFVQYGRLMVDLAQRVITLGEHLLELTPTEFSLLAYIVSEAPRVVSPQELVREAQGYEGEAWEASDLVRTHIHNIRRKIESASGCKDVIRTVRGAGYTIE